MQYRGSFNPHLKLLPQLCISIFISIWNWNIIIFAFFLIQQLVPVEHLRKKKGVFVLLLLSDIKSELRLFVSGLYQCHLYVKNNILSSKGDTETEYISNKIVSLMANHVSNDDKDFIPIILQHGVRNQPWKDSNAFIALNHPLQQVILWEGLVVEFWLRSGLEFYPWFGT